MADGGRARALVAAEQIERRFKLHFLLDESIGEILDHDFHLADIFLEAFREIIKDCLCNL